jgi:hypothetical protein
MKNDIFKTLFFLARRLPERVKSSIIWQDYPKMNAKNGSM